MFKSLVENQKGNKIKILCSDRGGEYFPVEFTLFCEENGIIHQISAGYTPQPMPTISLHCDTEAIISRAFSS